MTDTEIRPLSRMAAAPAPDRGWRRPSAILGIAVAVLIAAGMFAYLLLSGFAEAESSAEASTRNIAQLLDAKLSDTLLRTDAMLDATTRELSPVMMDRENSWEFGGTVFDMLKGHLNRFPELLNLTVYDAAGTRLYSTGRWLIAGQDVSNLGYFQRLRASPSDRLDYSDVFTSVAFGVASMRIARPVRDAHGQFSGIVQATISLSYLQKFVDGLNLGRTGMVTVRRRTDLGVVIRTSGAAGSADAPLPAGNPVRKMVEANRREAGFQSVSPDDGVARIGYLRQLDDYPFLVVVGMGRAEVLSGWYERAAGLGAGSLLILLVLGLVYRRLGRSEARNVEMTRKMESDAEELHLLDEIFEHIGEAVTVSDAEHRFRMVNSAFTRLTGYGADEVRGRRAPEIMSDGSMTPEDYAELYAGLDRSGYWQGEMPARRKDGSVFPKWQTLAVIRDAAGAPAYYVGTFSDITEEKEAEERLSFLTRHDALTGLPNRDNLGGRLEQAIAQARRQERKVAVMLIDLDRFKIVNETFGHSAGDALLFEVAARLSGALRHSDAVARQGGDEFLVMMTDIATVEAAADQAQRLISVLCAPYTVAGHEMISTPSIGIALFPDDGDSVEALLQNADAAMYHAKAEGRNGMRFFDPSMNRAAEDRIRLEYDLRQALGQGQFLLHYQPQIGLADGMPVGFEALVRWKHPERGLVAPGQFIPLAEEIGLIGEIGEWVLREALRQLREWRDGGLAVARVAVNLSAEQLRDDRIVGIAADALRQYDIEPAALELEVTESAAMHDPEKTIAILQQLRRLGVELAMDDFGTGYSSLSYLKLMPIQRLKLDQSFVRDIETDQNDAAICTGTVALAHELGYEVIAEGAETDTQVAYLRQIGGDVVQGYFFSRPLPPEEAARFYANALESPVLA